MKSIKNIFYLNFILALLISLGACNEDEGLILDENSNIVPSNIQAIFNISDDDTGTFTLTPSAEGAASFQILFGDETDETPTVIDAGESAMNVYQEGDFVLSITATSITGGTATITENIAVRFTAPEDLVNDIQIVNRTVTVTPSAANALMFEIFFGDVENEEATTIIAGNSVEHVYMEDGEFTIRTIARSASVTTIERTDVVNVVLPPDPLVIPIDFESTNIGFNFTGFEGATSSVVANPAPGGVNTTANVGMTNKAAGSQFFAGSFLELEEPIDFSSRQVISMDVLSSKANALVKLRLEPAGGSQSDGIEVDVFTTVENQWETLTYDFSGFDLNAIEFARIVFFFDFENPGDGSDYFFDNVQLVDQNTGGDTRDNLLMNGDFESGSAPWTIGVGTDPVPVVTESGNSFYSVNVETAGDVFSVNMSQMLEIVQGSSYQLTFDAWSDRSRSIVAGIGLSDGDFSSNSMIVNLTPTVQTFTITLSSEGFGAANARVLFDSGGEVGLVNIDNVTLELIEDPVNSEDNLLMNGDFEMGSTPWTIGVGTDPVPVVMENGNSFYSVNVETAGDVFSVNMSQMLEIVQGSTYTLTFDAWSDRTRSIVAGIGLSDGDFSSNSMMVNLTSDVQTFTLTLSSEGFGAANARVLFDNGGEIGLVNIDNVSLILVENPGNSVNNLLMNGDFEMGSDPWTIGVGTDPVPVVMENGNSFYSVNVETAGDVFSVNMSQMLEIVQGSNYMLTFDAWSDRERTIVAGIGLSDGDFSSNSMVVDLNDNVQTFTLTLSSEGFGAANARVLFDNGGAVGIVNIDNVSLVLIE